MSVVSNQEYDVLIYFLYAIEKGLVTKDEICNWADKKIAEEESPTSIVLDLSLAKSLNEQFVIIMTFLHLSKITLTEKAFKLILIRLYDLLKKDEKEISKVINLIFHLKDDLMLKESLFKDIYDLDNSYDMFVEGHMSSSQLKKRLIDFFLKYT
ncbi:hypothetical protein [Dysgonomonas macrotermitis]|uniref:Uncharacterized protein n=2 Tax=Dysgonomonas macrotermitis TaxID=1346286 RepID=A0A1M4W7K4_9BACT|nr:hypothetical protein [Dysgonomonas macrotermitis]SHE77135.1 hypothetical protein SAMN05444362_102148 [Dysgonomonas macrotermitis]